MKPRGMRRPLIWKILDGALGLGAPQRTGGNAGLAHAVALDAVVVVGHQCAPGTAQAPRAGACGIMLRS
jgi:hypothetical protein